MLLETDGLGTVEAEFTYIPQAYAQVISQLRSGDSSFYQFDGTSNVRQLTDSSQVLTDDYSFDAWGTLVSSTGSTANSRLWKGQYLAYRKDPDAGPEVQYAMHHRNYNPKTGVFTSADPAKDDLNLYRYVKNNPVNRTDPSGLEDEHRRQLVAAHHSAIAEFEAVKKELGIVQGKTIPTRTREEWQQYSAAEDRVLAAFRDLNSYKSPQVPSASTDSRSQRSRFNDALDFANAPSNETSASFDEDRRTRTDLQADVEKSQVGIDVAAAAVSAPFDAVASSVNQAQTGLSDAANDTLDVAMQWGEAGTRWAQDKIQDIARELPAHIDSEMSQAAESAEILQDAGKNFWNLPDEPGRGYWSRVGGNLQGYWNSISKTGNGIWQLGTSPIESAKGLAEFAKEAITHPGSTLKRLSEEVQEKSTTSEGRGEIVGDVLQTVFGGKGIDKLVKGAKGSGWFGRASGRIKSTLDDARKLVEGGGNRKPKVPVPDVPPTALVPERSPVGFQSEHIDDARKALDDPDLARQSEFHQRPRRLPSGYKLVEANDRFYKVIDEKLPELGIEGRLADGRLSFDVMAELDNGARGTVRGKELFDLMMEHFEPRKVKAIDALWSGGKNRTEFNNLTANNVSKEIAAANTWTGQQAARYGYKVTDVKAFGTKGRFSRVDVIFEKQ